MYNHILAGLLEEGELLGCGWGKEEWCLAATTGILENDAMYIMPLSLRHRRFRVLLFSLSSSRLLN
jgi:hypothetical protein